MKWTVATALGVSFGTAWRNFGAFLVVALVLFLPSLIVDTVAANSAASTIIGSLMIAAMTICGTYGAIRMVAGETTGAVDMLVRTGRPNFWPLVVLCVIQSVAIGFGFALLVVPGAVLLGMWAIAVPVIMVEGLGIVESLKRSAELTKGSRLTVISAVVAAVLLPTIPLIAGLIVIFVGLGLDDWSLLGSLIVWILGAAHMALLAPLQAAIYILQRTEKEGVTVAEIARQL